MSSLVKAEHPKFAVDPVCGMQVETDGSALHSRFGERTYFFCAAACQRSFEANPRQYLAPTPKKKGFWDRYLDRLNKATGGRPPSCCGG